jgi:ATP/maltotriose-dependent transcriptional regulator MalT
VAHYTLARLAAGQQQWAEAEAHVREARARLEPMPFYQLPARVLLSTVLLAQGRVDEARAEAPLGVRDLERMGGTSVYALALQLALAEACFAAGAGAEGDAALRRAQQCLHTRAQDIPEPAARERFLRQVPENARLMELLQQRGGLSWETPGTPQGG